MLGILDYRFLGLHGFFMQVLTRNLGKVHAQISDLESKRISLDKRYMTFVTQKLSIWSIPKEESQKPE